MNSGTVETSTNGIKLVYLRNDFYKKKFHTLFWIFILSLFGIGILTGMLVYLLKHPPHPMYFVADPMGRLIQDVSLQEPNMSVEDVTAWAEEAVTSAYTYSYINYRNELQNAQKYFTIYGWRSYMHGLQVSNNLEALTKRKYIQLGAVVQPPQLMVQGHMGAVYAYKFRMPVLVTYWYPPYDDKSKFYNPLIVTITIQRTSLLQSYKGLGVVQMNAELASSSGS